MLLAQPCGLHTLLAGLVRLGTAVGCNPTGKITSIMAGMIAGADCIGGQARRQVRHTKVGGYGVLLRGLFR